MSLTSNISSGTPGPNSVGSTEITNDSIVDTDINSAAAIDASKIADGSVSNAEFQYLNGVTSAIQTQLNAKQASDAELTAIAGLTSAANTVPSFTGPGTAALLTVGTGNNNLVQLDGSAKLPAVDGSALTNLPAGAAPTLMEGWFHNLSIVRATTTVAGDSVKITSGDGTALSGSNIGKIRLNGTTSGQLVEFSVTADVTIKITGATWGAGGTGDLTGSLLRVLAINDNGTLRWGVALKGGRTTVATADTTATQSSVTTGEHILCDVAVGSATNRCRELGYVRADFDDTGGAAEDLWAVQSGIDDCVTGETADGQWQPWNPTFTGFSSDPTTQAYRFMQVGRCVWLYYEPNANGTSNSLTKTFIVPLKPSINHLANVPRLRDNSVISTHGGSCVYNSGSTSVNVYPDNGATVAWTASGTCSYTLDNVYEV